MKHPTGQPSRFDDPEVLRALLCRLDASGPGAWRRDLEAADLMVYAMAKYGALARKHDQTPEDAAFAAFDAMRGACVRRAADPWAVVTQAVKTTLIAEERANGLLCSTHQARRAHFSRFHDAQRFSDREADISDYDPAFRVHPHGLEPEEDAPHAPGDDLADLAAAVFGALGWDQDLARDAIGYVCARLMDYGSRPAAFEALRKDAQARVLFGLSQGSWIGVLRAVLGHPEPHKAMRRAGRGMLTRLLMGETPARLLTDPELTAQIRHARPLGAGR
jgi:hypothetical protein